MASGAKFTITPGLGLTESERVAQSVKELKAEIAREGGGGAVKVQQEKKEKKVEKKAEPAVSKPKEAPKPAVRGERYHLMRSVGEECQEDEELAALLEKKETGFRIYDGFEPSGRMHIAQGILKTINVNKCTKVGGTFVFWVADWFALMNDKMGGHLDRIRTVGDYLIEVWKAAGMDLTNVQFVWSSDAINEQAEQYWLQMLDIARQFTLARITKCCQIMGRQEGSLTCAQILYPLMQCTDIFFLRADVCQLGLDQRKVNVLARDYCSSIGRKHKPIILSHHMMAGLLENQEKMSKSVAGSAIFMEDSEAEVEQKIKGAWCPVDKENIKKNPLLDNLASLVFHAPGCSFTIGDKVYSSRAELQDDLIKGALSADVLRKTITDFINAKLDPVRKHFAEDANAKNILELVKKYKEEADSMPKKAPELAFKGDSNTVLIPVMATNRPTFNSLVQTAVAAKKYIAAGKKVKVLLMDWTGYVLNAHNGERKGIKAVLEYTAKWLDAMVNGGKYVTEEQIKAATPELVGKVPAAKEVSGVKLFEASAVAKASGNATETLAKLATAQLNVGGVENTEAHTTDCSGMEIMWQSDVILKDPNTYWVSVINAGRRIALNDMMSALGIVENTESPPRANYIIAGLMFQQDVAASGCGTVCSPSSMFKGVLALSGAEVATLETAVPCFKEGMLDVEHDFTGKLPDPASAQVIYIDEADMASGKIKKGFCAIGESKGNPVIEVAKTILEVTGVPVTIKRKTEADEVTHERHEELVKQYDASGIHPGDLKAAVGERLKSLVENLHKMVAKDAGFKGLANQISTINKNMAKAATDSSKPPKTKKK